MRLSDRNLAALIAEVHAEAARGSRIVAALVELQDLRAEREELRAAFHGTREALRHGTDAELMAAVRDAAGLGAAREKRGAP